MKNSPRANQEIFPGGIRAFNVGVAEFALSPRAHGATVVDLDWRPPAGGDRALGLLLARLDDDPDDGIGARVAAANTRAVERLLAARPVLLDVRPAAEALPGLGARTILHAGPPIEWPRMCGPVRGAVIGAILYEGWARTPGTAQALAEHGEIHFAPCHQYGAVGPMAGIISPSMPVVVVENANAGNRAFATLNEGLGKVLRFGAHGVEVLDRLRWMAGTLGPALGEALRARGPVDLRNITAQALQMGDECHNRNVAATSLFARMIAPALVRKAVTGVAATVLEFLEGNNHFYLNLSMAACKAALDAAHDIAASTMVTAMARNGVEFGGDDYGYNQAQAQAAAAIKKLPGVSVVEQEKVPETTDVQKTMGSMIEQDGATLLFPTSFGYFDPHILRLAEKYPKIRFAHCGGLWTEGKHPRNAGSYFGYIDECQYLNGVVAGHASKSKKLGFIAAKPIPQVLRNINAFTLGARSVDPKITTQLIITGDWSLPIKEADAANSLIDQGVDVLTCHVDSPKVVVETAERRGISVCGYHADQAALAPKGYLTGAEWNWITPYTLHVKDAMAGKPMVNFLRGGLKEGFVKTSAYGTAVSAPARKNAETVKAQMMKGDYVIFKGPLTDNTGKTVIAAGAAHKQTDVTLEQMNYLVEGVIGKV